MAPEAVGAAASVRRSEARRWARITATCKASPGVDRRSPRNSWPETFERRDFGLGLDGGAPQALIEDSRLPEQVTSLHDPGPGVGGILGNTFVSRDLIAVDADRRQLALRSPGAAAGA